MAKWEEQRDAKTSVLARVATLQLAKIAPVQPETITDDTP